jgi:hypothetical protein
MTPYVSHRDGYGPEQAVRKHNMLVGMVCENMLAGRDAFFGTEQFVGDPALDEGEAR